MPGTPTTLHAGVASVPLSGTNYNDNFYMLEQQNLGVGCFILTGLVPSIGTGLSVNVSSGTAVLGAYQSISSFTLAVPASQPVVHLYLQQNGTPVQNTTGVQPAASVKLGTCATNATNVTSVNTNRSSGRQLYVRPEAQVPGGPGAGNLGSINLAGWAASAGDSVPVYGTLPAGALDLSNAVILAPGSSSRNVIQPTATNATPLVLKAIASQSVRLFELQDSTGALLGGIGPGGGVLVQSLAGKVNAKSGNYTVVGTDFFIPVDASSGSVTLTLPAANVATPFGFTLRVVKTDATANNVVVQRAGADTFIGGATNVTWNTQGQMKTFQSDGSSLWAVTG